MIILAANMMNTPRTATLKRAESYNYGAHRSGSPSGARRLRLADAKGQAL